MTGMAGFNASAQAQIQANNIVNLTKSMTPAQMLEMNQAMSSNTQAMTAARQLTQQLRDRGLLQLNQQVMGYYNGQVYISDVASK